VSIPIVGYVTVKDVRGVLADESAPVADEQKRFDAAQEQRLGAQLPRNSATGVAGVLRAALIEARQKLRRTLGR
jgi:hypothetical protein